jgi:long-chain acyl-CoA synthetase
MNRVETAVSEALRRWDGTNAILHVGKGSTTAAYKASEILGKIADMKEQLQRWGIREKFLVPIFLNNSTDFVVAFFALLHLGAIPVMAKMDYRQLELDEIFNNSNPQAVITEKDHLGFLGRYLKNTIVISRSENRFSLAQPAEGARPRSDIPDATASINYTYRGYGYPLGAMVSHEQYLHGARVLQDGLQGQAGERMLVVLPMSHIFTLVGCVLVPLLYRITSVIVDSLHPRFLFQCIRDMEIQFITAVPELYELLWRIHDPSLHFSSLRVFVCGGSVLTAQSYLKIKDAFEVDLCHGYGLTEFTPVSRNCRGNAARPGTVGPLCDKVQCQIREPEPDGAGEILARTPYEIGNYYHRLQESCESHADGWFKTGDIGRMEDGHLVFKRELKRTRKVNGNIVDLAEVERAILLDTDISDARAELENGFLTARLALSRKVDFDEKAQNLKSSLREILAGYKIPKKVGVLS